MFLPVICDLHKSQTKHLTGIADIARPYRLMVLELQTISTEETMSGIPIKQCREYLQRGRNFIIHHIHIYKNFRHNSTYPPQI